MIFAKNKNQFSLLSFLPMDSLHDLLLTNYWSRAVDKKGKVAREAIAGQNI